MKPFTAGCLGCIAEAVEETNFRLITTDGGFMEFMGICEECAKNPGMFIILCSSEGCYEPASVCARHTILGLCPFHEELANIA